MSDTAPENKPAEDAAAPAKIDFERAEMEEGAGGGMTCAACQKPIHTEYWQILDKILCDVCSEAVDRSVAEAQGTGTFARAVLHSGVVALGCGIGYAVFVRVSGFHFGLITIGIGWVVGRAVQKVTHGFGTVKHQVLAVALTYFASSMGYLPAVFTALTSGAASSAQTTAATSTSTGAVAPSAAPAETPPASPTPPASAEAKPEKGGPGLAASLVLFTLLTTALTLAAPLIEISSDFSLSGLLGVLIICFGLREAWRTSRGVPATMTGPHRITPTAAAP